MTTSTTQNSLNTVDTSVAPVSLTTAQHIAVLAFGALILFAVGFSPMPEAHNAAHDTRHSLAFPCH